MLNQKALDYIFDVNAQIAAVNAKIDAKLSRHSTKLNRFHRDMERVYRKISIALEPVFQQPDVINVPPTRPCISMEEQRSLAMRSLPHLSLSPSSADKVPLEQPSKQTVRRRIGFSPWEE